MKNDFAQDAVKYCLLKKERQLEPRKEEKEELIQETLLEKETVEKLKKILKVSDSIKLEMMRKTLKLDEDMFNYKIFDWASEFNFRIRGDEVVFNQDTINDFIEALDSQFKAWGDREKGKTCKID